MIHTGAEWSAVDRWVKAEQEEKGVRGPKTIAAEAEAWAIYKAAREAENKAARDAAHKATHEVEEPVEEPVEVPVKKIKVSLPPPSKPLVRQAPAPAPAPTPAPPSIKTSRLAVKRTEILAKMATIKKTDLTGLDDWVDPNNPYAGCDYESS